MFGARLSGPPSVIHAVCLTCPDTATKARDRLSKEISRFPLRTPQALIIPASWRSIGVRGRSRTGPRRVARSSAPGHQGSFPSFQTPRVAHHENASAHVVQTDNHSKPVLHTFALPTELPLDAEGTGIEPVTQSPQSKYPISAVLFART